MAKKMKAYSFEKEKKVDVHHPTINRHPHGTIKGSYIYHVVGKDKDKGGEAVYTAVSKDDALKHIAAGTAKKGKGW